MNRNSGWRHVGVASLALAVCLSGFAVYAMNSHPLPISLIEMTQKGDLADDVLKRLGRPSRISDRVDGESWVYSGMTWCYVTVNFDENGVVDTVIHDH